MVDRLTRIAELVRAQIPLPPWWPQTIYAALGAMLIGLLLALWGARLLRTIFILAFMVAGAAVGIRAARSFQVDDLIGLVLGTGFLGLVGHLLYRWWLGVSAGLCLVALVAVVFGVRNLPAIETEVGQIIPDYISAAASAQHGVGQSASAHGRADAFFYGLRDYFWKERRQAVYRAGFVLGLAWLTGLGMGLTLPRFTAVIITSIIGTALQAGGAVSLVSLRWPTAWAAVAEHGAWLLAGVGLVLIVSFAYQARHSRPAQVVPLLPVPQTA